MKTPIKIVSLITLLGAAPFAAADTIFGVYAGAGVWQTDFSGEASEADQADLRLGDLGVKDEDSNFYYIAIEHPVPVIPNIKLQAIDISLQEQGTITATTVINGQSFTQGDSVNTDFDFSHTDVVLYYELLDNWITLDFGITGRVFDGYLEVTDSTNPTNTARLDLDDTLPMIYLKGQFDLPLTGLYATATANWIGYSGSDIMDLSAGVGFMSDGLVLDIGFELGVRNFSIKLDDVSDVDADIELDGAYGALIVHF